MELLFATGNLNKLEEFREALSDTDVTLKQLDVDIDEIDADDVSDVAVEKALDSYNASGAESPVMVDDTGLYVEGLNGFPGSMSGYFLSKVGLEGFLKLMEVAKNRNAYFKTSICIYYPEKEGFVSLNGFCKGRISETVRGSKGFGYDPVFIPEGYQKTFGESLEVKRKVSHRVDAINQLRDHLKEFY